METETIRKQAYEAFTAEDYITAIDKYYQIIMTNQYQLGDLNLLGIAYIQNGNFEEAMILFTELIKSFPDYTACRMNLSVVRSAVLEKLEMPPERKIQLLNDALHYNPTNVNILCQLAEEYVKLNRYREAFIYSKIATHFEPKIIKIRILHGEICLKQDMFCNALEEFKEVLKIEPDDNVKEKIKHIEKLMEENAHKDFNAGQIICLYSRAQEVCPNLFIGSQTAAENLEELKRNKITHILNATTDLPFYFENLPEKFSYFRANMIDSVAMDITSNGILDECLKFIENAITKGGKVFVHCQAGISRSGSIVVAYLMKTQHLTYEEALIRARKVRGCICPNAGFEKQLKNKLFPEPKQTTPIISKPFPVSNGFPKPLLSKITHFHLFQ